MKKIVPLKGYVLITFESEGSFQVSNDILVSQKTGLVVDVGGPNNDVFNHAIEIGDRIYFTQFTGHIVHNDNGVYAFISYMDIIGKEIK